MKMCEECSGEFDSSDSRQRFCSQTCSAKHNNRGVRRHGLEGNCLICETPINKNRKFCSRVCSAKYKSNLILCEINSTQNEDQKYKHRAMKSYMIWKYGHKCMDCGLTDWKKFPIPLEIHHVDGRSKNNMVENLELLCPNCHTFTETYKAKNRNCDRR